MSSCCTGDRCEIDTAASSAEICPTCGHKGLRVEPITLEALFTPDALRRGVPVSPRFCPTEDCPVVYFDNGAAPTFTESRLIVRVHAKHPHDDDVPVCYCFLHSRGTIRHEIEQKGWSDAYNSIAAEVKAGRCACEVKNPKGTCCLGDVAKVEREASTRLHESTAPPRRATDSGGVDGVSSKSNE